MYHDSSDFRLQPGNKLELTNQSNTLKISSTTNKLFNSTNKLSNTTNKLFNTTKKLTLPTSKQFPKPSSFYYTTLRRATMTPEESSKKIPI